MPDEPVAAAAPTPTPTDTSTAPLPLAAPPATPQRPLTPPPAPEPQQPAGAFFKNLSHSFTGAVLGAMAGREKIASYTTDETGKQTPVVQKMTTGDQLRQIARSALLGLSAGAQSGTKRSGLATALAGAGAGAEDAVSRAKEQDLLKRKQSTEEFERGQKVQLDQALNAHTMAETLKLRGELRNADIETQQKQAAVGMDWVQSAKMAGNQAVPQDFHSAEEALAFRKDNPDYLKYTPFLVDVQPVPGGTIDPQTGKAQTVGTWNLVDVGKPTKITQTQIDHLQRVGLADANTLQAGQELSPTQFKSTVYQGNRLYNEKLAEGWQKPQVGWAGTGKDKVPMQINSFDGTVTKPFPNNIVPQSVVDAIESTEVKNSVIAHNQAESANQYSQQKEHLANAAMIGQSIGNPQAVLQNPDVQQFLSTLPSADRSKLLSAPPKELAGILAAAHGDVDAKNTFPQRVYAKSGQLSYEDAVGFIQAANPGWNAELFQTLQKQSTDYAGEGPNGKAINSFNQFFNHAADVKDVSDRLMRTNSPILNMPLNKITDQMLGQAGVPELKTAIAAAREEWQTFIHSGRGALKEDSEEGHTLMSDKSSIGQIMGVLNVMGTQAVGRLDPINETWRNTHGTDYPNLITPRAREAITKLGLQNQIQQYKTGGTLRGVMAPQQGGQGAPPTPQNVAPKTGPAPIPGFPPNAKAVRDANKNIIGYTLPDTPQGQYVAATPQAVK